MKKKLYFCKITFPCVFFLYELKIGEKEKNLPPESGGEREYIIFPLLSYCYGAFRERARRNKRHMIMRRLSCSILPNNAMANLIHCLVDTQQGNGLFFLICFFYLMKRVMLTNSPKHISPFFGG